MKITTIFNDDGKTLQEIIEQSLIEEFKNIKSKVLYKDKR